MCYGYITLRVLKEQALRRQCDASEGTPIYPGRGLNTVTIQHPHAPLQALGLLVLGSGPHKHPALDFSRHQTTQTHLLKIKNRALNRISLTCYKPESTNTRRCRATGC